MCRTKSAVKSCQTCGTAVEQKSGKGRAKRFCGRCLKARHAVGPRVRKCVVCSKAWTPSGRGRNPKYCSADCRLRGEQIRRSAQYAKLRKNVSCSGCGLVFVSTSGKGRLCGKCSHRRPRKGVTVTCKQCGGEFYRVLSSNQCYCSRYCLSVSRRLGALSSNEEWIDNEAARTASIVDYVGKACRGCGRCITRVRRIGPRGIHNARRGLRADTLRYCSKECAFWHKSIGRAVRHACRVFETIVQLAMEDVVDCSVCGHTIPRGRSTTCSDHCKKERGRQKARDRYESLTGVRLMPASGPRPCRLCDRIINPDHALGRGRNVCDYCNLHRGSFRARATLYGVYYEHVSRVGIFRRDGWRCQLCGKKVLRKSKRRRVSQRLHPRTASLDHIVPMVRGGPHVESNVQCACLGCNVRKNARLSGQMRLF